MNFGLLLPHLPHLPQSQQHLHPDVLGARERAPTPTPPPCRESQLAARWRDLRSRVFRV